MGKSKQKGGKRWIQELSTKDTVNESEGTFSGEHTAEEVAIELKRKSPTFQAAIGKITLYLNRAGKRLSKSRVKELERVKVILRELFNRKDRQKANKDRPIKIDIKTSSLKVAQRHAQWEDDSGKIHLGDQFIELLTADEEAFKNNHHSNMSWENMERWRDFLIDYYKKDKSPDKREKELSTIKGLLARDYWDPNINFPIWDLTDGYNKAKFEVITNEESTRNKDHNKELVMASKIKSVHKTFDNGETEITFASTGEALQYLADLMEEPITIKKPSAK